MTAGRPRSELPVARLLAELRLSGSLTDACRKVGVVYGTVFRRMRQDPDFAVAVNTARTTGREANFVHGSPGSSNACRCDICKFAGTLRVRRYKPAPTAQPCPECGRLIGSRGGKRYAHFSDPATVCLGSERPHGNIRALPVSRTA